MKEYLTENRKLKTGNPLLILLVWLGLVWLAAGCGELRPRPAALELDSYKPIDYQELLAGGAALTPGQKVRVKAYFWQFLNYDPAMVRNYLTLPRYPVRWYELQWFATYGSEDMRGYFDLAALESDLAIRYKPRRLEPVLLYGEVCSLAPGCFLQVHHLERLGEAEGAVTSPEPPLPR
jgi:hypothetical protein